MVHFYLGVPNALVSLPENWGTNPIWSDWSWYTDTAAPGLFSVSLLLESYLFPFVIHWLLLDFPNMHDSQRGTSYFKSINLDGSTKKKSSLSMDLVWKWYNLSYQDLNSYCKCDNTSENMIFSIFSCVILFDSFMYSSEEIWVYPISGTFLGLNKSLVTIILFPIYN